ncbi:nickel transporter [Niveomyces insectorum RCEF 264]|uniref:Nickel/cobalt efflux system n=1 Tax=Niveomyces insectorum RCEF 264 TaxID=1081102 RepID=A0A167P398_9HYPO|nr:nickel transporter [Niveomyces insectorum RCEF 264]
MSLRLCLARLRQWMAPRVPRSLRVVPAPAAALIGLLVVVNLAVWVVVAVVLRYYPGLTGPAVLSYTLGLRHALDADHISAIDLMTRRLIASGQRPVAVGTFFSLGHSTIVIITCIVVAATSGALRARFDGFERVGNIIGTSVSAAVLLILCAGNAWVLWRLVRGLRVELRRQHVPDVVGEPDTPDGQRHAYANRGDDDEAVSLFQGDADAVASHDVEAMAAPAGGAGTVAAATASESPTGHRHAMAHLQLEGGGVLIRVFRKLFVLIDRPWKMYPLGVLFGLGFDTSSEVALLGIASIQGAQGTSIWLILIFPALFTAGMCLVDTSDGALMMALYTSKTFARDTVAILYYSIVLTGITIVVAAFIGVIQVLTLVDNVAYPTGSFWDGVGMIGDNFDIVGGCICGVFVLTGVGAVLVYRPWRRRMDRALSARALQRRAQAAAQEGEEGQGGQRHPQYPQDSSNKAPPVAQEQILTIIE